jgi:L-asparagine oxygenase
VDLLEIGTNLLEQGYVFGETETLHAFAKSELGPIQPGGLLIPQPQDRSQNTHSGMFGLGEFPWHTDGAVSDNPPRWLILSCLVNRSSANTQLYLPKSDELEILNGTVLRSQNSLRQIRYLPAISDRNGVTLLRWDPRACPPGDTSSSDLFRNVPPDVSVTWREGASLIVDNFRLLHRRTSIMGGRDRLIKRGYVY